MCWAIYMQNINWKRIQDVSNGKSIKRVSIRLSNIRNIKQKRSSLKPQKINTIKLSNNAEVLKYAKFLIPNQVINKTNEKVY